LVYDDGDLPVELAEHDASDTLGLDPLSGEASWG